MNQSEMSTMLKQADHELGQFRETHGKRWPAYAHTHFAELRDKIMQVSIELHKRSTPSWFLGPKQEPIPASLLDKHNL